MKLTHHLIAVQNIKHEIRAAMETVGIDCNGLPFWQYANALMDKNGFDPLTVGAPPAAVTLDAKLEKVEDAKAYLAAAINQCGGLITETTPFRDYADQIRLCSGMAGASWATVGGVAQGIQGAVYATDGYIYLLGSSKVWKTADLETFIELSLVGEITGYLGGICECSGQRIVIGDSLYAWVKPANEDTFYKTSMQRPSSTSSWLPRPISGTPDSPVVWLHSTIEIGESGKVRTMNIDTAQDNFGTFDLHPSTTLGRAREPGILTDDAEYVRWIFTGQRYAGYYIRHLRFQYAMLASEPGVWRLHVFGDYGYANADMNVADTRLAKTPNGRIWAAGYSSSKLFSHYSDNHGISFTDPVLTTLDLNPSTITALRSSWLLVGSSGAIRRIRNNFQSIDAAVPVEGSPTAFVRLPGNKILCCTSSTSGTNLYITEA